MLSSSSQDFSIENTFLVTKIFNVLIKIHNFGFSVTDIIMFLMYILFLHTRLKLAIKNAPIPIRSKAFPSDFVQFSMSFRTQLIGLFGLT